jgi:hypothetical protein
MRWMLFVLLFLFSTNLLLAQCATYKITSKGDTLNCTDVNGQKRGKWKIRVEPLRGNPGYEEEGEFVEDRKEGIWRRYNMMGDLIAIQNYKWGNLDGISQYFTLAGIEREESWLAMNPKNAYDTLMVEDINDENKYVQVIIPNDGKSLKHGRWTWYRPGSMTIIKTEVWNLNKLKLPGMDTKPTAAASDTTTKKAEPAKVKPKEVEEFEKKNKKGGKVRDGRTG